MDRFIEHTEVCGRSIEQFVRERLGRGARGIHTLKPSFHTLDILLDLSTMLVVGLNDTEKHLRKARHVVTWHGREIGAAIKGLLIRRQEDSQRPTPSPTHKDLYGLLVDVVQIRAFLPIYLYIDEVLIHQLGDVRVLE